MNANEIATKADIEQIMKAIEELKCSFQNSNSDRQFLRSSDVRRMLNISDGTLQRLRISSKLCANKVNGTWFYKLIDIQKLMGEVK